MYSRIQTLQAFGIIDRYILRTMIQNPGSHCGRGGVTGHILLELFHAVDKKWVPEIRPLYQAVRFTFFVKLP